MKRFPAAVSAAVLAAGGGTRAAAGALFTRVSLGVTVQTARTPSQPSHEIYGTVRSIKGSHLTLATRTGKLVQVDDTAAMRAHLSVTPVMGHELEVRGTYDKKGVLHAKITLRAKDAAAMWPPDR